MNNKRGFQLRELTCLIVFLILSVLFSVAMIIAGFVCQYKKESTLKSTVYECGVAPLMPADIKFEIRYFNYAIAFLIFDIETVFLYPFAVYVNELGLFAIIEAFIFISILLFGLFFIIKKNLLRWL